MAVVKKEFLTVRYLTLTFKYIHVCLKVIFNTRIYYCLHELQVKQTKNGCKLGRQDFRTREESHLNHFS